MKTLLALLTISFLCPAAHAISNSGLAEPKETPVITDPTRAPVPQTATATGSITSKDGVKQLIQVRSRSGEDLSFYVDTNTPISDAGGKQISFEELQPGAAINVNFLTDNFRVNQISLLN